MPIVDGLLDEGISVQLKFLEEEVKRDRYARANAATTLARLDRTYNSPLDSPDGSDSSSASAQPGSTARALITDFSQHVTALCAMRTDGV